MIGPQLALAALDADDTRLEEVRVAEKAGHEDV